MSFEMWESAAKILDVKLRAAEVRIAELEKALLESTEALERMEMHCAHPDVDVPRRSRKVLDHE